MISSDLQGFVDERTENMLDQLSGDLNPLKEMEAAAAEEVTTGSLRPPPLGTCFDKRSTMDFFLFST
jgi:hypothetical protein